MKDYTVSGCIVTYNGEIYQWWTSGFGLTIKKQNEDLNSVTILIDRAYMKARSNEACKIVDFVDKKAQVYFYAAGIIEFDGTSWNMMDPTFASTSKKPKDFITNDSDYLTKYVY